MKVRALTTISTVSGKQDRGDIFECSDKEGAAWIKAGFVEAATGAVTPTADEKAAAAAKVAAEKEAKAQAKRDAAAAAATATVKRTKDVETTTAAAKGQEEAVSRRNKKGSRR
jgi:hypothetical protein